MSSLSSKIAEAVQTYGRKASSGEPLFFDRNNLERVIEETIRKEILEPSSGAPTKADRRSSQGEDKGPVPGQKAQEQ